MKAVVFYKLAEEKTREDVMVVYPRHRARVDSFIAAGKISSIGSFSVPSADGIGSMGIFANKETAEEFIAADPFVLEGLVGSYELLDYHDVVE